MGGPTLACPTGGPSGGRRNFKGNPGGLCGNLRVGHVLIFSSLLFLFVRKLVEPDQKRPDVHKIVLSIKYCVSPPPPPQSVNFEDFLVIRTVFPYFGPFFGGRGKTKFCGQDFYGHPDFSDLKPLTEPRHLKMAFSISRAVLSRRRCLDGTFQVRIPLREVKTIIRPASSLEPLLEGLLGSSGGFVRKFPEGGLTS